MFQKQSQLLGQTFSVSPSACLARRRFQSAGSQAGASGPLSRSRAAAAVTADGSRWPLKEHHSTTDTLGIRNLFSSRGIIRFLQVNQCALPASSLGVVTGSRLKGKLTLTSCHSPAHTKLASAPKLLPRRS